MIDILTGLAFALLAPALGLSLTPGRRVLDPAREVPTTLVVASVVAFLLAGVLQLTVGDIALAVIDGTAAVACVGSRIGRGPLIRWATAHPTSPGARLPFALHDAAGAAPYRRLPEPLLLLSYQTGCQAVLTVTAGEWTTATLRCDHGTYAGRDPDGLALVKAAAAVAVWRNAHTRPAHALTATTGSAGR